MPEPEPEPEPEPDALAALARAVGALAARVAAHQRAHGWGLLAAAAAGWAFGRCAP
jgi:hypothetical protein